ncbi:Lrp/AsnC family transcriptional regulator [Marinovum sp. 2_MG-2023]|uniref:Lrp/AsnC family transcriptional regulator n=1 Tax=unclassified Marinovum TaxID=2647166 RepID=UPI0026E1ABAC|nr:MULTISPECIES: Lrp/AsnC family transcriptional regulator [unclassified Marinovum]MDO6729225.1 Lrp/AsnC family transcriptional regulator [Marinovum sp. 2_MG-2023]MDO6779148.1 Lrp/AsnC family transcriptional regulator [Marinovum sp. 1_MG-2023]
MQHLNRDSIDRNLIAILQEDARLSTSEISRRLGVARSTITERIARLELEGVILGYTAVVCRTEDGQETQAFVSLECDRVKRRQIIQTLRQYPEIKQCVSISGQYDMMCTAHAPCAEDIDALIEELAEIPGIRNISTTIVLANKFSCNTVTDVAPVRTLSLAC